MRKFIGIIALLGWHCFAASVDPNIHWRSLRTPHFEIIYPRDERELADTYGVAAEQAYQILTANRFSEAPSKTFIVLDDLTDLANGESTFIPYPVIQVYPVLPDSLTSLDYYGNWPLEMIMHEYTHILNFEPAHGFYVPFKYVFGNVIHPNGILPRWYLEGLAVESESRYTEFGRLKSPRTFAELRALSQDGRIDKESIDRINETILPDYPYGERPYLYGSILWEHMLQSGPEGLPDQLNQRYGRRFPFFINTPVEDVFHKDYAGLLGDTYSDIDKNAKEQIATVESKGPEKYSLFKDKEYGMEQYGPAISPDGSKLIFLTASLMRGQIRLIERDGNASFSTGKSKKLYDAIGSLRLSWAPDGQSFVFDAVDEVDHYHTFRELYEYNFASHSVRQLTKDLRAQDPGVSPDGKQVAFVGNLGNKHWLGLLDRSSLKWKRLFHPGMGIRLTGPEFISDHEIVFTARTVAGRERIYLYDLKTSKTSIYFSHEKELRRPKKTGLGLLVATTSSGVENIAIADLKTQKLSPITNTATEIQSADWDSRAKELIATRFTGDGRRLVSTAPTHVDPPNLGSMVPAKWPGVPGLPAVDKNEFKDSSYQPIEYLWPRYWIPFAYPVYNGVYLSGATTMSDPAGINTYTASMAYDTVTNRGSFGVQYVNSSLPPDIELSYVKSEQYLGASGWVLEESTATGDLAFFLPHLSPNWKMTTGFMSDRIDSPFAGQINRQGPFVGLTYSDWDDPRAEGAGTMLQFSQEQFLRGPDQLAYSRTMLGITQAWKEWLPETHRIVLTGKSVLAPDLPLSNFGQVLSVGDSSLGANYLVSLSNSQFLFRGYPNGTFIGRKIINWNLEYQFPISTKAYGWDTKPVFNRGWDASLIFDGISVDGASYNPVHNVYYLRGLSEYALSTGFEAHWNTTVAYQLPLTWVFGLYFGFDQKSGNDVMPFLGLAMSDMSAIDRLRKNWFKHL